MRITRLAISNFKAITEIDLQSLDHMVVIAGPNGCGKSCIFDGIRLLKSAYGGYQPNEMQSWFGEFQLNANEIELQLPRLLQRQDQPMRLAAEFVLSAEEIEHLRKNVPAILLEQIWREVVPNHSGPLRSVAGQSLAANLRAHQGTVDKRWAQELPTLLKELESQSHLAELTFVTGGRPKISPSRVLELIFKTYDPGQLGVIDYHSASRNYAREQVGGINLNIAAESDRQKQHALYNSAAKYNNLKTQMASAYVRQLLAKEVGAEIGRGDLTETLKELFLTFFPGKTFLGPTPTQDGAMAFPVRTPSGHTHDIDDLSSGEKEVLYGYLRLRNAAPRHSILLIDEPELHLNPRLVRGLAAFYYRHIGLALNNQLWLVTHSDTLIREAVGQVGFSVFHMQAPGTFTTPAQLTPIQVTEDFDRAVIDIAGDLAAYRPGEKVVVFEGGGDSEFDVRMTSTLFPDFQERVNSLSGGGKRRVAELYKLLESARQKGVVKDRFFAITDRDNDGVVIPGVAHVFAWDRYHIENYLLNPSFILAALKDLNLTGPGTGILEVADVEARLIDSARDIVPRLVSKRIEEYAYDQLRKQIELGFDPKRNDVGSAIAEGVSRSSARLSAIAQTLTRDRLASLEESHVGEAESALKDGTWRDKFPGRSVLKQFAGKHGNGVGYATLRDIILSRMRDEGFRPAGMKAVVDAILAS